ncbi:hypothetical protein L3V59_29720 [Burkholderia aenigmatica]|uniref:hypothetical protein n=1 Tax=Burkholderia aenigmatica TaxID=2015348 RepID=UPI001F41F0B5|nr:hypothetical protein [Burkholderia aenigmatica]UKD13871.1 hypothetical protein L3V59_29720 [Burkholderia aenigmatica]
MTAIAREGNLADHGGDVPEGISGAGLRGRPAASLVQRAAASPRIRAVDDACLRRKNHYSAIAHGISKIEIIHSPSGAFEDNACSASHLERLNPIKNNRTTLDPDVIKTPEKL